MTFDTRRPSRPLDRRHLLTRGGALWAGMAFGGGWAYRAGAAAATAQDAAATPEATPTEPPVQAGEVIADAPTLTWEQNGQPVTLRQQTGFPQVATTALSVEADGPVGFALRIRVPNWTRGLDFRLNGQPVAAETTSSGWATIQRTWQPGDQLLVALGAGLRALPVDRFHPRRVALAHGPVVLGQDAVFSMPFALSAEATPEALDAAFTREDEGTGPAGNMVYMPLDRGTAEQPVGGFRPLYDFGERRPHRVYHDLDAPRFL